MDGTRSHHRPRISRETRLLLLTAFLALAALWMLARVRFPDQPAGPANPVQPILTQLGTRPRLDDLAAEISQLRARIEPLFAGPALRVTGDAALMLLPAPSDGPAATAGDTVAADRATRLALVRVPPVPAPPPVPWTPEDPRRAQYLVAAHPVGERVALEPTFVPLLVPTQTPVWSGGVWALPGHAALSPGTFVFTTDGLLAGLVVDHAGGRAIVPGSVLLMEASRLASAAGSTPGYLGIEVQPLTPPVTRATGATSGVVVTWVDPEGPAAAALGTGDVIEAIDGETVATVLHWEARAGRVAAGIALRLRVRTLDELRSATVTAAAQGPGSAGLHPATPAAARRAPLGLTLTSVPGTGAAVTAVAPGSAAQRAGLAAGDIITRVATTEAPSPAAVRRSFDSASEEAAVLVAYTRAGRHAVTALEP